MVKLGGRLSVLSKVRPRAQSLPLNENEERYQLPKIPDKMEDKYEGTGRQIMIVVDSSKESTRAMQWALSNAIQSNDLVILLHVVKPPKQVLSEAMIRDSKSMEERAPNAYKLVNSLKNICYHRKPEVKVEVAVVEGRDKGPKIVEEARRRQVSMLVLGQRKLSVPWRLFKIWATKKVTSVVDYCIQNADCMAIAVRRKNKRHGGYLITTKRHKDFWLLA